MGSGVAVVTGGSKGIGAATARLLAHRGWSVCLTYLADGGGARSVVDAIEADGGTAWDVRCDVGDERDVVSLFAEVDGAGHGPLAVLVNNAGVVDRRARVDELDRARLQRLFATNVFGTMLCAREARRMSTVHGGVGGAIVNVSSAASRLGSPGEYVDYAATKGAVDTFTVGLAREVATEGIRVNAVRPGIIDTGIHVTGGQPDRVARLGPAVPMRRAGEADEVASAVAWLASDEASYCTGAILDVSGGR
jgi:NAD(P)-dependent dehydrogenase (short-subunit alcohol dehydrogenase family)